MTRNTVLIVEDEKDIRDIYSLVLERHGYSVCTATNGREALTEIKSCQPQLILLDIFMPVLDGEGFLRQLDLEKYPGMSVVVCSNTSDQSLMNAMIKLGAKKVVTKSSMAPTDLAELVEPYLTAK